MKKDIYKSIQDWIIKTSKARIFFAGLIVILMQGCFTTAEHKITPPGENAILRVGFAEEVPQLLVKDDEGNFKGLEIDLINILAKENGYLLETSLYSKKELSFALRRGEIDIAVPSATDSVISSKFLLPCAPHLKTGQRILVKKSISMFIQDKTQLNHDKITVVTVVGSISADFAKKIFPEAKLISLKDIHSCIFKVLNLEGHILMVDASDAWMITSPDYGLSLMEDKTAKPELKTVLAPLTEEQISWAVRKSDVKWRQFLDSFILRQEKNGTLGKLIRKNRANIINK